MTRPLRLDPADGIHHLMNRSARRYDCFLDDRDRRFFIRMLADACDKYGAKVLALCLMGNHFHLVVQFRTGGVSDLMKQVSENYTRAFNQAHGYDGPLFRSRFKSLLVNDDEYLINLVRYVHRNPLELGYRLETYRWSTFPIYCGRSRPPDWIDTSKICQMAGGVEELRSVVETDREGDEFSIEAGVIDVLAVPHLRPDPAKLFDSVDRVVSHVMACGGLTLREAQQGRVNRSRDLAIVLASESRKVDAAEIASHYGYGSKASLRVSLARARRAVDESPELLKAWTKCSELLRGA